MKALRKVMMIIVTTRNVCLGVILHMTMYHRCNHLSSCAEGEQSDCAELGIAYAEGEHIVQNFDRSVALLRVPPPHIERDGLNGVSSHLAAL